MIHYVLSKLYPDDELERCLSERMGKSQVPVAFQGNFLFFQNDTKHEPKLCVITAECRDKKPLQDEQIREHLAIMARKNWHFCCVSSPDQLLPLRRRLIFQAAADAVAPPRDETIQRRQHERARKLPLRWFVFWLLLFLLGFVTAVPFMLNDGFSLPLFLVLCDLLVLATASFGLYGNRRQKFRSYTEQQALPPEHYRLFRRWEKLYLTALFSLFLLLFLFLTVF